MKKINVLYVSTILFLAVFSFSVEVLASGIKITAVNPNDIKAGEQTELFQIKNTAIIKNGDNDARFDFKPTNILDNSKINYWKVRMYCDEGVVLKFNNSTVNNCGEAIDIQNIAGIENNFSILFSTNKKEPVGFYFKLKAYDQNGDWLHSERAGFRWY